MKKVIAGILVSAILAVLIVFHAVQVGIAQQAGAVPSMGTQVHTHLNAKQGGFISYPSGSVVIATLATQQSTTQTTPTKVKEVQVFYNGNARVTFTLLTSSLARSAIGQIYKNGSPVGTLRSNGSTTGLTYTEDITGLVVNDLVQLYLSGQGDPSKYTRASNMTLGIYSSPTASVILN